MKKGKQPRLVVESGPMGRVGVLRDLRQIQLSVPDRHFFVNKYRSRRGNGKKKDGGGFFSGLSFSGGKKIAKLDIETAVEKVKMFHNSFQGRNAVNRVDAEPELGKMSVSEMNDFRRTIKEAASGESSNFRWIALNAIVNYIDLKNSGVVSDKLLIQQDCLRKIGEALHEDGGLSMFHATWFLTVYRDYLSGYRMFRQGEVEHIIREGGQEAGKILKNLKKKQFEIPVYLSMVDESSIDVKMLFRYSKDNHVKRSRHGQEGCTRQEIRKLFQGSTSGSESSSARIGKTNEVNIIMAYAMLFARIPMLYEVVESIKSAIPNTANDGRLYKQKITLAQKIALLDIARVVYQADASDADGKKLYALADSIYKYSMDVIGENALEDKTPDSSIQTFPTIKQAAMLISYGKIFGKNPEQYLKKLEKTSKLLQTVKKGMKSGNPILIKIGGYADIYAQKIDTLAYELRTREQSKAPLKKAGHS